jgi:hypothetical protein
LALLGTAIYFPAGGVAGRYTVPAVWGLDILLALLLTKLMQAPVTIWKRGALVVFSIGLLWITITNLGKQFKATARNELLWQALEHLEHESPKNAEVVWLGSSEIVPPPQLQFGEGEHFQWHLQHRGRVQVDLRRVEHRDRRTALAAATREPESALVLCGFPPDADNADWQVGREFRVPFWLGFKSFQCYLWVRKPGGERTVP